MFVRNWRGMERALRLMRNDITKQAYAFQLGITPNMSEFGTMNTFIVALCHCFEVAMKSLAALYGPFPEGHRIEKLFKEYVDKEVYPVLQEFWEQIPPHMEIETPVFMDAIKNIDGAFLNQRYAPWAESDPEKADQKLQSDSEWMWLFIVTSYVVTMTFTLQRMRSDATGRIRILAVECFREDGSVIVMPQSDDTKVGTAVVLCVIDTPLGSTVPLMIDLSRDPSIRVRQTGAVVG